MATGMICLVHGKGALGYVWNRYMYILMAEAMRSVSRRA